MLPDDPAKQSTNVPIEQGPVRLPHEPHWINQSIQAVDVNLQHLPVQARNVKLEWIIGGVFYVISFEVGEGLPYADFDFQIPGPRGGTHRTRFYGHIEGVTAEACSLALQARQAAGKSMHQWLNDAIINAANKDLGSE